MRREVGRSRRWIAGVLATVMVLGMAPVLPGSAPAPSGRPEGSNRNIFDIIGDMLGLTDEATKLPSSIDLKVNGVPRNDATPAGIKWGKPKRVKELTEKRTANTTFWQLDDGRVQAEISSVPTHHRDANGLFQPIDTTVRGTDRAGFVNGNTTNSFTSLFSDSSERLVRFEAQGRHIELGLDGAAAKLIPTVSGSTVTYPGAAKGADVVYEVTANALKETLVLAKAPHDGFSYTFTLSTGGLEPQRRDDGSIAFVAPGADRAIFSIPAPFMFDKAGARSDEVTQTLQRNANTTSITLTADAGWLADPARQYPVSFDPTIRLQPVPTDAQDVQIYSGDVNRNYNNTYQLGVGTDLNQTWRSLVRFPMFGVPSGVQLDDAKLQMYYGQTQYSYAYDVALEARKVTVPWNEGTATWSNMNANFAAAPAGNTVQVDDSESAKIAMVGSWPASTNSQLTPFGINSTYRFNNDATAGHTFTWIPTITEDGDYQVEVHYVSETDRPTNASYTVQYAGGQKTYPVDQTGPAAGVWKTLGVHPFVAGTTGKVVLGDVANKAVIADAVRLTKSGVDTKKANISSIWNSFSVRNIVQGWLDAPTTNNGFMIKAVDEGTKGRGGPIYQGSEYFYNNGGRDHNLPKLVLTWGKPGAALQPPATITANGALLNWDPYVDPSPATGDNIVEYQVHRSVYQSFLPTQATMIAPIAAGTTTYQDTTAKPTPAATPEDQLGQLYYYMIAVKTQDGSILPAVTEGVRLPKSGMIKRVYNAGTVDTNLSALQPNANVDSYAGDPFLSAGNNSTAYGDTRALLKFSTLDGIPAGAQVANATLRLWTEYNYGATNGFVDAHKLNRAFDETTATWNKASATTSWTTPGGDFDAAALSGFNGYTNDPEWETWDTTLAVKSWLGTPSTNHGFLLKMRDEAASTQRVMMLSSEAQEPMLRPTLEVTYLENTATSTYYVPDTPQRLVPATTYTTKVSLSNPTATQWNATDWELSYRWNSPDGTDVTNSGNQLATALPSNVATGQTVEVNAQLKTPVSSIEGNKRTEYVLRWELRNKVTGQWLSQTTPAITSLDQRTAVEEPTSDQLGIENFYSYGTTETGAGSALLTNLYSGNTVWTYESIANPSRGLTTSVGLSYNSMDTSNTVAGYGWSLKASSLIRLGLPLNLHPNPNPTTVVLTDGDGTSHTFSWDSATSEWKSPKGVHLFLQRLVVCDSKTEEARAWSMVSPDRTQYFYDCDGYLSSIEDNNGNMLSFVYEVRRSQNKPTKFLRYITDSLNRQTLTLTYWAKGDTFDYIDDTTWTKVTGVANLTNPHIIDRVRTITDISGRKLNFTYTDKGLLGELIDGVGASQPKVFKFAYDMTQGNKNVKLIKVTDPRGNFSTVAYYDTPDDDPKFKWWTKNHTDRLTNMTSFAFVDPDGPTGSNMQTTVTDPESHTSVHLKDSFGRTTQVTDAKNQVTKLGWDSDHNMVRLEEANAAVQTWVYDQKTGYPTEVKDAEANARGWPGTTMTYQSGLNGYWADLTSRASPEGRLYTFAYSLEGDLVKVTDPVGNSTPAVDDYTTVYTYDTWGQLLTLKDANGNVTTTGDFDANGLPQTTTDPQTNTSTMQYDARGNTVSVTDANSKASTYAFDAFGRSGETRVPLQQSAGSYIVTPAPDYDANDNVLTARAPNAAQSTYTWDAMDRVTASFVPPDTTGGAQRKTSYSYDKVGNLLKQVEPKGNATTSDPDDFTRTYVYDVVYQMTSGVNADGGVVSLTYDNVGNVLSMVDPKKSATADPNDFTTKFSYDLNHRAKTETDGRGFTAAVELDKDGLVVATVGKDGQRAVFSLDQRGLVTETKLPHDTVSGATTYHATRFEYDQVGNRVRTVSPKGVATTDDPDDFAEITVYDSLNRVKEQILPYDLDDTRYNVQDKIISSYDKVGNLIKVSSPPSAGQTVRNDVNYTYFDNGWLASSVDQWALGARFEYNSLGQQSKRVSSGGDGAITREQTWSYYPDGKLRSQRDEGLPTGTNALVADNSDIQNTVTEGPAPWTVSAAGTGFQGYNYLTHAAGTGANKVSWYSPPITEAGPYDIWIRYPAVADAATNASFKVKVGLEEQNFVIDQTQRAGEWINLGRYWFDTGFFTHRVEVTDNANGIVVADAAKFVRYDSNVDDLEFKDVSYTYDVNGNLTLVTDDSAGAVVDEYAIGYDELNRNISMQERYQGAVKHNSTYGYDPNSNLTRRQFDALIGDFEYDAGDMLTKVTNSVSSTGPGPKVTTFGYNARGQRSTLTRGNGNIVDFTYFHDGLLKTQKERTVTGAVVSEHTLTYDDNSNRLTDLLKLRKPDNSYFNQNQVYTYDPRDRIATATRTETTNGEFRKESYVYDANSNVVQQTMQRNAGGVDETVTTDSIYDRNRLLRSVSNGQITGYHHDAFGRLASIFTPSSLIWYRYDAFDRKVENFTHHDAFEPGGNTFNRTTTFEYDPLDRMIERVTGEEGGGNITSNYTYQGRSSLLVYETGVYGDPAQGNAYHYGPTGELLVQDQNFSSATGLNHWYHSRDPHGSVEAIGGQDGHTQATYGYTAYGSDDQVMMIDDGPDLYDTLYINEPLNTVRYNGQRMDWTSGTYDMGTREYRPDINRFLTPDSFSDGGSDMALSTSAGTSNRYGFAGANPVNFIDFNGHNPISDFFGQIGEFFSTLGQAALDAFVDGVAFTTYCMIDTKECAQGIAGGVESAVTDPVGFAKKVWHESWDPISENWNSGHYGASAAFFVIFFSKALQAGKEVPRLLHLGFIPNPGRAITGRSGQVPYWDAHGATDLSYLAGLLRHHFGDGAGRDIAIFEITAGDRRYLIAGTSGGGLHAEERIGAAVDEFLARGGMSRENVSRIYSELSPCRGGHDCRSYVSTTFYRARVTYSFRHDTFSGRRDWARAIARAANPLM